MGFQGIQICEGGLRKTEIRIGEGRWAKFLQFGFTRVKIALALEEIRDSIKKRHITG